MNALRDPIPESPLAVPDLLTPPNAAGDPGSLTERSRAGVDWSDSGVAEIEPPVPADRAVPFGSDLLAIRKLALYFGWTLLLLPAQLISMLVSRRWATRIPVFYHRRVCKLVGIDVGVVGTMSKQRPTLFVSNHSSYLDIEVLGGQIPGSFIAKSEVAGWPFFGFLSKLQRTVYVDRKRRSTGKQRDDIASRLDEGDNLILFPEGTSDDGNRILPFRSALLSVAERRLANGEPLLVQPVSVAYIAVNGIPMGFALRPFVAWYGDMSLGPHLWQFCRLGRVRAIVEFHPPVTIDAFGSRKALTKHLAEVVADGMGRAIAGHSWPIETV